MRSLSLLACLFFSFQIFSQTSVFFAKPVSLSSAEATEDIAYGQALSVDMEAWLDNTLDRIMVEHMEESRSMKKDDLLPFSPPAENMSLSQYAMEVAPHILIWTHVKPRDVLIQRLITVPFTYMILIFCVKQL